MKKFLLLALVGWVATCAYGAELRVSNLAVPAAQIGADWTGPTGLAVDDVAAPTDAAQQAIASQPGLAEQMKALGVKGMADFTYRKKSNPLHLVTLRVFLFQTEEQCRQWIQTKYQFSGWEAKYKRITAGGYSGFDSLEIQKRIVYRGALWVTAGTNAEQDDHLKILGLLLERVPPADGADGFIRQVVQSLLAAENPPAFAIADKVFAMDNGETLSREELRKAWPDLARRAWRKPVSAEAFFRDIQLQVGSPRQNKRLMSNQRVLAVYTYQEGDLYIDASQVKAGVENFIGYAKAFVYLIRKVNGTWTLIGIGG